MVERFHRDMKAAIRSRLNGPNLVDELPWVLLCLRTAPKEDIHTSAAEMVYGTPLMVPDDFVCPSDDPVAAAGLLSNLRDEILKLRPILVLRHGTVVSRVPNNIMSTDYVLFRHDAHRGPLHRIYDDLYHVIERADKTFVLDIGGRLESVSIDRLKCAHADRVHAIVSAKPLRRGRPPRIRQTPQAQADPGRPIVPGKPLRRGRLPRVRQTPQAQADPGRPIVPGKPLRRGRPPRIRQTQAQADPGRPIVPGKPLRRGRPPRVRQTPQEQADPGRPIVPVSRFEFTDESSVYWPIIGLGTRECGVAMRCVDPAVQCEFFARVSRLKTFDRQNRGDAAVLRELDNPHQRSTSDSLRGGCVAVSTSTRDTFPIAFNRRGCVVVVT